MSHPSQMQDAKMERAMLGLDASDPDVKAAAVAEVRRRFTGPASQLEKISRDFKREVLHRQLRQVPHLSRGMRLSRIMHLKGPRPPTRSSAHKRVAPVDDSTCLIWVAPVDD